MLKISFIIAIAIFMLNINTVVSAPFEIGKSNQNYPPYHWLQNGKIVGIIPDVLAEITKQSNIIDIHYHAYPWRRILELAKNQKVDAIFPLTKTTERLEHFNFVEEPIIYEKMTFATLKNVDLELKPDLSNIHDFTVGVVSGYRYPKNIEQLNLNKLEAPNDDVLLEMLEAKRVQLIIIDRNIYDYFQVSPENSTFNYENIQILALDFGSSPLYLVLTQKPELDGVSEQLSTALTQLKASGEYQKIINKYIDSHNLAKVSSKE